MSQQNDSPCWSKGGGEPDRAGPGRDGGAARCQDRRPKAGAEGLPSDIGLQLRSATRRRLTRLPDCPAGFLDGGCGGCQGCGGAHLVRGRWDWRRPGAHSLTVATGCHSQSLTALVRCRPARLSQSVAAAPSSRQPAAPSRRVAEAVGAEAVEAAGAAAGWRSKTCREGWRTRRIFGLCSPLLARWAPTPRHQPAYSIKPLPARQPSLLPF